MGQSDVLELLQGNRGSFFTAEEIGSILKISKNSVHRNLSKLNKWGMVVSKRPYSEYKGQRKNILAWSVAE